MEPELTLPVTAPAPLNLLWLRPSVYIFALPVERLKLELDIGSSILVGIGPCKKNKTKWAPNILLLNIRNGKGFYNIDCKNPVLLIRNRLDQQTVAPGSAYTAKIIKCLAEINVSYIQVRLSLSLSPGCRGGGKPGQCVKRGGIGKAGGAPPPPPPDRQYNAARLGNLTFPFYGHHASITIIPILFTDIRLFRADEKGGGGWLEFYRL